MDDEEQMNIEKSEAPVKGTAEESGVAERTEAAGAETAEVSAEVAAEPETGDISEQTAEEVVAEHDGKSKKKKGGKIALYILYGVITVFVLVMILSFNDIGRIFEVLSGAQIGYVFAALGLLLAYLALSPIALCILTKSRKNDISVKKTYVIGMTEHFFNGITPFATGGQPFQVYAFARSGVRPAESTGLLLMNFIIYQIVISLYSGLALIFYSRFATNALISVIAIVGFSVNFLVLACAVAIATSSHVRRFLQWCVKLLCKIKFIAKFLEPQLPKFNAYMEQVQVAFKDLLKKPGVFFSCLGVKAVAMAAYYAITFFVIRALGIDIGVDQLFFVICGTAFAVTMVIFLPTPGSSGGVEFAFSVIFATIIGAAEIETISYGGMLIWRLMTYYLAMLISLAFYIGFEINCSRAKKRKAMLEQRENAEHAFATEDIAEEAADENNTENKDPNESAAAEPIKNTSGENSSARETDGKGNTE